MAWWAVQGSCTSNPVYGVSGKVEGSSQLSVSVQKQKLLVVFFFFFSFFF